MPAQPQSGLSTCFSAGAVALEGARGLVLGLTNLLGGLGLSAPSAAPGANSSNVTLAKKNLLLSLSSVSSSNCDGLSSSFFNVPTRECSVVKNIVRTPFSRCFFTHSLNLAPEDTHVAMRLPV